MTKISRKDRTMAELDRLAAEEAQAETVNRPPHYTFGKIEVIDAIDDWKLGFHLGNVVKYVARAGKKNDMLEDLRKARWYLDREIAKLQAK